MRMSGLLLVSLAMVAIVSAAQARPSAPVTAADDVRELGTQIAQIHPDAFRSVSRAALRVRRRRPRAAARRASPANELLVGMLRIIASLGPRNGHTGLFPGRSDPHARAPLLPRAPVRLRRRHARRRRDRPIAHPESSCCDRGRRRSSRSSSSSSLSSRATTRRTSAGWRRTTCSPPRCSTASESPTASDAAELTFEQPDGQRVDVALTPVAASRYISTFADPLFGHYPSILPRASQPLYLSGSARPLWARTLAGGRAVYVGYNSVRSPAPAVLRKIERLVRGKGVRRVIVDLRLNGGGDNTTYGSLTTLFGSKAVNKRGRLRVLIGRATFSAAANFAAEIDRATRAVFVGEPTGGGVETYARHVPRPAPDGGVDRSHRRQVPRAQEEQERSPARGRRPTFASTSPRRSTSPEAIPCSTGR